MKKTNTGFKKNQKINRFHRFKSRAKPLGPLFGEKITDMKKRNKNEQNLQKKKNIKKMFKMITNLKKSKESKNERHKKKQKSPQWI